MANGALLDDANDYGLTDKAWRFVNEVMVDWNHRQAAIRAGYSEKGAKKNAERLVQDPRVKAALSDLMEERSLEWVAEHSRAVQEVMACAYANMADFAEWGPNGVRFKESTEIPRHIVAAVVEIKQTKDKNGTERMSLKLASKARFTEMLGRHIGLFEAPITNDNKGAFSRWAEEQLAAQAKEDAENNRDAEDDGSDTDGDS